MKTKNVKSVIDSTIIKESNSTAFQTTATERFFYGFYFLGQCALFAYMQSFLQLYFTDIAIPATVVGIILLFARFFDAAIDPFFGLIVDKTNFKGGKYKPWLKLSAILIPLFTVLTFAIPSSLPTGAKIGLGAFFYILWGVSYTICDIPIFSLVTSMTTNVGERDSMIAYGRIAMFVGAVAVGVAIPVLYPILGWLPTTIVLALISFVALAPISRVAKERYRYTATHTLTPKEIIKSVTKNKYLFIFCIAYLIANAFNATMAVGSYFAIYCMGSTKLYSVIMLTSMLPLFFVAVILPALIKKFDKYVLTMWATGLSILMTVVLFLCGYTNHTLFYIMYAIRGTFLSFSTLTFAMFIIDCSEYGWYMTGENTTAVTVSLQTFTSKLSIALSGSIGMFILGVSGFISGTNAVQPSSVNNSLWFMMSVLPAVGQIIAFIILLFGYRLRDRDVQIMSKVNHGEITREEAQALISKKF